MELRGEVGQLLLSLDDLGHRLPESIGLRVHIGHQVRNSQGVLDQLVLVALDVFLYLELVCLGLIEQRLDVGQRLVVLDN